MGNDITSVVLDMIERWESGVYHSPCQRKASLQVMVCELIEHYINQSKLENVDGTTS